MEATTMLALGKLSLGLIMGFGALGSALGVLAAGSAACGGWVSGALVLDFQKNAIDESKKKCCDSGGRFVNGWKSDRWFLLFFSPGRFRCEGFCRNSFERFVV